MSKLDDYLSASAGRFEDELCELLRIPSVSADSKHKGRRPPRGQLGAPAISIAWADDGIDRDRGASAGLCRIAASGRCADGVGLRPLRRAAGRSAEPVEVATVRADASRWKSLCPGATDDKGQMFTHVKSAEAWLKTIGKLPLKLKFLIEGEEEVGSEHLDDFIAKQTEKLRSDVAVISDCSQFGPGQPAITYGLRGIALFELLLTGPDRDLHSGTFGGAVMNPAIALSKIMAALVDEQGRIKVPGFYDDVLPLTELERKQFAALPFNEAEFKKQTGVEAVFGEEGYTTLERRSARPTFDINGLTCGYQGEGTKTVLPSKASAKFGFRLVPNQNPQKIGDALEKMLRGDLSAQREDGVYPLRRRPGRGGTAGKSVRLGSQSGD